MSFLDAKVAREDDQQMVALHEQLIRAYPDKIDALSIAGSVGILQADIEVYPKTRLTWWSILNEATKDSQHQVLRRLVANVLRDPTRAGARNPILAILDVPEDQLLLSPGPASKARKAKAKAVSVSGDVHVGARAPLWAPGTTIRFRFLEGEPALHERIKEVALELLAYVNLSFDFDSASDADVRIAFRGSAGWTFVGTNCLKVVGSDKETMNLALTADTGEAAFRRAVLGTFAMVLGMWREHSNPASTIKWNKQAVYDELTGPPNYWTRADTDYHIFSIWPPDFYPFQKIFDLMSILMSPLPSRWFAEGHAPSLNYELSPVDKQFIAGLYPRRKW